MSFQTISTSKCAIGALNCAWGQASSRSMLGRYALHTEARRNKREHRYRSSLCFASLIGASVMYYYYVWVLKKGFQYDAEKLRLLRQTVEKQMENAKQFIKELNIFNADQKDGPFLPSSQELGYPTGLPTLVLNLENTLISLQQSKRKRWQVIKRPGAEKFVKDLSNYYEIVVWSNSNYPFCQDVIKAWKLPVFACLNKQQCDQVEGTLKKDISKLGRNIARMVQIDCNPQAISRTASNAIILEPFEGNPDDKKLFELLDLLKTLAVNPEDVRDQIRKYGGGDNNVGLRFMAARQESLDRMESKRSIGKFFGIDTMLKQISPF